MSASGRLFMPVGLANSLEQKFRWLSFPGLIRGIGIIHFFMFVLLVLKFPALQGFVFNWELIKQGEYWRVGSFLAIPPIIPYPGGFLLLNTLFSFFLMKITFLLNDSLEEAWGAFRTSIYVYATIACTIAATLLLGPMTANGGFLLYSVFFVAFASLYPHIEFRLMFVLPVKVGVLGVIVGVLVALNCFQGWPVAVYLGLVYLPYLTWAVPKFIRWYRIREKTASRRADFQKRSLPVSETFHKCEQCGATDGTHPERDFRVTQDDRELCEACLELTSSEDSA